MNLEFRIKEVVSKDAGKYYYPQVAIRTISVQGVLISKTWVALEYSGEKIVISSKEEGIGDHDIEYCKGCIEQFKKDETARQELIKKEKESQDKIVEINYIPVE